MDQDAACPTTGARVSQAGAERSSREMATRRRRVRRDPSPTRSVTWGMVERSRGIWPARPRADRLPEREPPIAGRRGHSDGALTDRPRGYSLPPRPAIGLAMPSLPSPPRGAGGRKPGRRPDNRPSDSNAHPGPPRRRPRRRAIRDLVDVDPASPRSTDRLVPLVEPLDRPPAQGSSGPWTRSWASATTTTDEARGVDPPPRGGRPCWSG